MIWRHDTIVCRRKNRIRQWGYPIKTPRIKCIGLVDIKTDLTIRTRNKLRVCIAKKTEIERQIINSRPTVIDIQWNNRTRQIRIRVITDLRNSIVVGANGGGCCSSIQCSTWFTRRHRYIWTCIYSLCQQGIGVKQSC